MKSTSLATHCKGRAQWVIVDRFIFPIFGHFNSYSQLHQKMTIGRDTKQYMQSCVDNRISVTIIELFRKYHGSTPLSTLPTIHSKGRGEAAGKLTIDLNNFYYKKLICQM